MTTATPSLLVEPDRITLDEKMAKGPGKWALLPFSIVLVIGLSYIGMQLFQDLAEVPKSSALVFLLLGTALMVALGFEFVNGFHDTANAVATVIYTHSLEPHVAVVWSGVWNFIGVLTSSGAVAFGIIALLPVELILQVSGTAGFAMVFALLSAAIIWNLGTWYFGLPSSSSHTLIGSVLGVGIANQLMSTSTGTSGVDWAQAANVGKSLFLSPLVGFASAALLLILLRKVVPDQRLYKAPEGAAAPPFWIRGLLVLTCTGVSFAHGSNDGQKGMGLIMLILVGTVPTAYALNHTVPASKTQDFIAVSHIASDTLDRYGSGAPSTNPRADLKRFLQSRKIDEATLPAASALITGISRDLSVYKELKKVPAEQVRNFRNDMYMVSDAIRLFDKTGQPKISPDDTLILKNYRKHIDAGTKFIPSWVKVAVALALGLGTMVGWKRIVVTVGEKIGKDHLTYAQGASAEIVAMTTIGAADAFGLPVSTTHVLSSGVAGTMAANRTGLQIETVRNLLLAWVLTLPVSMALAGSLYWLFSKFG